MKKFRPTDFGVLAPFFKTPEITEVMINSWDRIFVEHQGLLVQTSVKFNELRDFENLILQILNLKDTASLTELDKFTFDGTLPEGFRYNITLPPITPRGPTLTIRKFSEKVFTLEDLVDKNSVSEKVAHFLKAAVTGRLTIVVSGGTGSGKTSFLNSLSLLVPDDQRVVSIEDTPELRSAHANWISMISSKSKGFSARDGLVNSLRMRPDRIIIGECRGTEAYDFLSAINTGHEGSMTSLHANSAQDALSRLENLITLGQTEIPLRYIRAQIASGIDLIVHLKRDPEGHRRVVEIIELTGMEGDVITRASVFSSTDGGPAVVTGYVPQCVKKMNRSDFNIAPFFFEAKKKSSRSAS